MHYKYSKSNSVRFSTILLAASLLLQANVSIARDKLFLDQDFSKQANISAGQLKKDKDTQLNIYWEEVAKNNITWFQPWTKLTDGQLPHTKWFVNGKLNLSYNCLDRHVENGKGDKIAYIYIREDGHRETWTYKQLLSEVNKISNTLTRLKIKKGDKVAIYMPTMPESIAAMLAVTRVGAVHTVIFGGIASDSIQSRVDDAEAKLIITSDGSYRRGKFINYLDQIRKIRNTCRTVKNVMVLKRNKDLILESNEVDYHKAIQASSDKFAPVAQDSEDMLFILYTSGSTGKPKGIFHTVGGYTVGVQNSFKLIFDYKDSDVYWSTADIGWITGHSYVVYGPLTNGATQVIYEGAFDYPNKSIAWDIIEKEKVTIFYTAPTLVRMFMQWGDQYPASKDLSSIRLLGSIGEPINPEAWYWYRKNIGNDHTPIVDTWFQTETGSFVIAPVPGVTPLKPGSPTVALPGYDVDILDEEGNSVKEGFLAIKNSYPSMLRGVYKNEEKYKATYWSKWDGKYYLTGDKAVKDDNGYIQITGRSDDVMKVAGHLVGSAEVENAAIKHIDVAESAAIGVPDPVIGTKIILFTALKDGRPKNQLVIEAIKVKISESMGKYACPAEVVLVDKLPKTKSGKIMRRVLRQVYDNNPVGDTSTLEDPTSVLAIQEALKKKG